MGKDAPIPQILLKFWVKKGEKLNFGGTSWGRQAAMNGCNA